MLTNLHVKNLALIEEAEVAFGPGLNILTGETGAGKSILLGSVNLALGAKFDKEMLRKDAEQAYVELTFAGEKSPRLLQILEEAEIPSEEEILISRRMSASKSVFRINGEVVSVKTVKEAAEELLDIHGQHEHQSLLKKAKHLEILDAYAGAECKTLCGEVYELYQERGRLWEQQKELSADAESRKRETDFLAFEIEEIENAALQPGEDETLEGQYQKMSHAQKLTAAVSQMLAALQEEDGVSALLSRALYSLRGMEAFDEGIAAFQGQLYDLDSLASDLAREASSYLEDTEWDEESFVRIEERLNEINRLKEKYGHDIGQILRSLEQKRERLQRLQNYEETAAKLQKEIEAVSEKLREKAGELTACRKKAAQALQAVLTKALQELNFLTVDFRIDIRPCEEIGSRGGDDVEFMISTNPGEAVRELKLVASGGELSRIMLAIKTILARKDAIDTLLFDEIDTGISGRTAWKVAEALQKVAEAHQVICITHLPQIAAMADRHFVIEKIAEEGSTETQIRLLSEEASLGELGRLLGMEEASQSALENAREMKRQAALVKEKDR